MESGGRHARRRGGGGGDPRRAPPRPHRDAALRGDGLARARALRPPRGDLRRARARRLDRRRGPRRLRLRRPRRGPARGDGRPRDRPRGARRRLDGRAHRGADGARPPRARGRPRDRHPGVRPRGGPRRRAEALGRALRGAAHAAASTASSRPTATRRCPSSGRTTIDKVLRQRLGAHEHPDAVADALHAVPRSRPFESWDELGEIAVPTVVVASRDEADPGHPYAIGERYAEAIPGARAALRGAGQLPAGLAGRPALEGDQRAGGASGRSRAMISSADSTTRSRS